MKLIMKVIIGYLYEILIKDAICYDFYYFVSKCNFVIYVSKIHQK